MQEKPIRNKQLTSEQIQNLRNQPQYLQINKSEFVLYNLTNKQSNSGLFKNQRLLVLDIVGESICYLSKIPQGLIPFQKYEEVKDQQPKQWIHQKEIFEDGVNKFTCHKLVDKNAIQIKLAKKEKKVEWIYYFANQDVMKQWYTHISFLFFRTREEINQLYHPVHKATQVQLQNAENHSPQQSSVIHELNDSKVNQPMKKSNLSQQNKKFPQQSKQLGQSHKIQKQNEQRNEEIQPKEQHNKNEQSSNFIKNKDTDSQFKQFEEHTPLGAFLRVDVQQDERALPKSKITQNENYDTEKRQQKKGFIVIKQQSLENSKKQTNSQNISLKESRQHNLKQSSLSGLEYQPISRHGRITQQENSRDKSSQRYGSIKKQSQASVKKQSPSKHKKWNSIYQNSSKKTEVYFEFAQQSIKNAINLVNKIINYQKLSEMSSNKAYGREIHNGIQYVIGFTQLKQEMLLYQTSDDQPIVYDLYDDVKLFKEKFFSLKRRFANEGYQDSQLPLSILLEFKLVPVLCLAVDGRQYSFASSQKSASQYEIQEKLLQRMQLGELNITSSLDFREQMRRYNVGYLNWGYLYKMAKSINLRELCLAEIFCQIFLNVLRSQLYHIYANFPIDQDLLGSKNLDDIISKCSFHLIQRLLTQNPHAKQMWQLLKTECQRLYNINGKREDVNQNYLLFAILQNGGFHNLNEKFKVKNKMLPLISYWIKPNEAVVSFKPIVYCLQYQKMTSRMQQIATIISQNNYQFHKQLLAYRDQVIQQIPKQINYLVSEINLALTATLSHKVSVSREIYQIINTQQPSNINFMTTLSKIGWLLIEGCDQEAVQLASQKIELITFYVGKSPLLAKFYEVFSKHQIKQNQYQKALASIKRQIQILHDSLGAGSQLALLKRIQLSEVYLELSKREDCLRELSQSKKICEVNNNTENEIYKEILAKLSKVALNMGKYNDCINNTLISLKQLQKETLGSSLKQTQAKALEFLKVIELLSRAFELAKRKEQQLEVVKLTVQRCKQVHSYKVYCKLLKLALYPFLKRLTMIQSQTLLEIVDRFEQLSIFVRMTQKEVLSMISKTNLLANLEQKILNEQKNLKLLNQKILNQKVFQKVNTLIENSEEQIGEKRQLYEYIINWVLIIKVVTPSFIQALIKDNYYQ